MWLKSKSKSNLKTHCFCLKFIWIVVILMFLNYFWSDIKSLYKYSLCFSVRKSVEGIPFSVETIVTSNQFVYHFFLKRKMILILLQITSNQLSIIYSNDSQLMSTLLIVWLEISFYYSNLLILSCSNQWNSLQTMFF